MVADAHSVQAPLAISEGLGLRIASAAPPLAFAVRPESRLSIRDATQTLAVRVSPLLQRIAVIAIPAPPLTSDEAFAAGTYGGAAGFIAIEVNFNDVMDELSADIGNFEDVL